MGLLGFDMAGRALLWQRRRVSYPGLVAGAGLECSGYWSPCVWLTPTPSLVGSAGLDRSAVTALDLCFASEAGEEEQRKEPCANRHSYITSDSNRNPSLHKLARNHLRLDVTEGEIALEFTPECPRENFCSFSLTLAQTILCGAEFWDTTLGMKKFLRRKVISYSIDDL
ncbi:hypothetical protein PR048_015731 [Dryococelus australis]|uniref:Uncharacterized protein n=1 Tax=Dryococelus australis TaxID=614101 RepID=A0ABQ9HHR6_9NEOP|nr:hypothetical protein PR048_015731 [Dryococelus australis]